MNHRKLTLALALAFTTAGSAGVAVAADKAMPAQKTVMGEGQADLVAHARAVPGLHRQPVG